MSPPNTCRTTIDGRDAAEGVAAVLWRGDRPTDSSGRIRVDAHLHPRRALNISLFWNLLFYFGLPPAGRGRGDSRRCAAMMVVFISAALLGSPIRLMAVYGGLFTCGTAGVALLWC